MAKPKRGSKKSSGKKGGKSKGGKGSAKSKRGKGSAKPKRGKGSAKPKRGKGSVKPKRGKGSTKAKRGKGSTKAERSKGSSKARRGKASTKSRRGKGGAAGRTGGRKATGRSGAPGTGKKDDPLASAVLRESAKRARDWLAERRDYYGYLARRARRRGAPEMAGHLRGDVLARQDRDGSWRGGLVATAEAIEQLLNLGVSREAPAIRRGTQWLYGRQNASGAYHKGCTPARHEQALCEHYLSGFFSPGPSSASQEITLPNGQSVTSDSGARLLASERALRTLLRVDPNDPRATQAVAGLRSVPLYLEYGGSFTPAVLVGAVQGLARAPSPPGELSAGLDTLARNQAKDGTWPNVELFFVLEMLLEVEREAALPMLEKALPQLLSTQHKYGAWGRRFRLTQTWIAVRALEAAVAARRAR